MTKPQELELFESLARTHRFREWLDLKLAETYKVLSQALDADQIRRAQGYAQGLQGMVALLDAAKSKNS